MQPTMSRICLGTAQYGSQLSAQESWQLLDRYTELGGNFVDTAHVYGAWDKSGVNGGAGNSEAVIGEWFQTNNNRADVFVGTKGGHPNFDTKEPRLTRSDVLRELDESLTRLQTDYIDLYWLHRDDRSVPVDELLGWLEAPLKDGRIKAIGVSNWRTDRLAEGASANRSPKIAASQIAWSMAVSNWSHRDGPYGEEIACDSEVSSLHKTMQLPLVAYSSQAGGFFASKYDDIPILSDNFPKPGMQDRYGNDESTRRREVACQLGQEKGCSTNQIALAYLLHQPFPVYPIVGPRSVAQLDDAMQAISVTLTTSEFDSLHAPTVQ